MNSRFILEDETGYLLTQLTKEEENFCRELAIKFGKREKWTDTQYGKGILNSDEDPTLTERTGIYFEYAIHLLTGLPLDTEYKEHGNRFDFPLYVDGKKITIETKSRIKPNLIYPKMPEFNDMWYIKARGENQITFRSLLADYFIFGFSCEIAGMAFCKIAGWADNNTINRYKIVGPAISGNHDNYYIHSEHLNKPMDFLYKFKSDLPSFVGSQ